MAFYYDHANNDYLFSEHEFYGGNIGWHPALRPFGDYMNHLGTMANDFPNLYGDVYEYFRDKNAALEAQGYGPQEMDPIFKVDHLKEVRAARDRGDRRDRSVKPGLGYGGLAFDMQGYMRPVASRLGEIERVTEPVAYPGEMMPPHGSQIHWGGVPLFYPF